MGIVRQVANTRMTGIRSLLSAVNKNVVGLEFELNALRQSDAASYALKQPASRIRSHLFLEVVRRLGGSTQGVIGLACAIELLHTASLIIDDLPSHDNAMQRRGRPCLHLKFGEDVAVLTAFELVSASFTLLGRFDADNGHKVDSITLCDRLLRGPAGMLQGQLRDLRARSSEPSHKFQSLRALAKSNYQKSGAPFRFVLELAAMATGNNALQAPLGRIGLRLGYLYQYGDDLEDRDVAIQDTRAKEFASLAIEKIARETESLKIDTGLRRLLRDLGHHFGRLEPLRSSPISP